MARRKAEMSGIFDWFKRLAPPAPGAMIPFTPPPQKAQLPAQRETTLPAPVGKPSRQLSLFDFLRPEEERVERGLILPELPKPAAMFEFMAPSAPKLPPKAPEEERKIEEEVWGKMFKPSEEPMPPPAEMFEFLKPAAQFEARRFIHPDEWPFGEPPIWSTTPWQMPSTFELAEFIRQKWDLPAMYEFVLSRVESPYWKKMVEESPHLGEPASMDVDLVSSSRDPYSDMAHFLRIPDYVIENYGLYGPEGIDRFTVEVLQPMFDRVGKALDVFRPTPALRGWFELEPDEDMNFWIRYKETKFTQTL